MCKKVHKNFADSREMTNFAAVKHTISTKQTKDYDTHDKTISTLPRRAMGTDRAEVRAPTT